MTRTLISKFVCIAMRGCRLTNRTGYFVQRVLPRLLQAIQAHDVSAIEAWQHCEQWANLTMVYSESPAASVRGSSGAGAQVKAWQCSRCTFINEGSSCAMCGGAK